MAEAAIVPSPDPLRLAVPKAFITLAGNQPPTRDTALAIFRHCRADLAPYKRVRRLEFAELPKTISGKIRRVELRTSEAARRATEAPRAASEFWEDDFPGAEGKSALRTKSRLIVPPRDSASATSAWAEQRFSCSRIGLSSFEQRP